MFKECMLCLCLVYIFSDIGYAEERVIAITIDDLPFVGGSGGGPNNLKRSNDRLLTILQTLIDKNVPATGFVIAGAIAKGQWPILEQFRRAGFNLGNHTYSHKNLNFMSADKYIADMDKADRILSPLFSKPKYFRYPYLAEGNGNKRQQVYDYLAAHNYVIAPVTIDSKDFMFNQQLFAIPYRLRPQYLSKLRARYLAYIWKQTLRAEKQAAKDNKPAKQILLIHANLLNSHFLGDIIDLYKNNGYRFIPLAEALNPEETKEEHSAKDNTQEEDKLFQQLLF